MTPTVPLLEPGTPERSREGQYSLVPRGLWAKDFQDESGFYEEPMRS